MKVEVATKTKTKKCWKDYVEIKWRCHLGYCCRACWYCLPPCWGRNLSPLKAFIRALRICLCSSVLQDTHLRGKLLKPSHSFIELLLPWEKIHFKKTPAVKLSTFGVTVFTSAWHLNSVYPKIKQQKLQHWMQETHLQMWVSSPASADFEGIFFQGREQLWLTLREKEREKLCSGSHPAGPLWFLGRLLSSPGLAEHHGGTGIRPNDRLEMAEQLVYISASPLLPSLPIPSLWSISYCCWGRIRDPGASRGSSQSTFLLLHKKLRAPISLHSVPMQHLFLWIEKGRKWKMFL